MGDGVMRIGTVGGCIAGLLGLVPLMGQAAQPAAIVEAVLAGSPPLTVLEVLEVGRRVELAPGDRLRLGYLASCTRETREGPGLLVVEGAGGSGTARLAATGKARCKGTARLGTIAADGQGALQMRSIEAQRAASEPGAAVEIEHPRPIFIGGDGPTLSITPLGEPGVIRVLPAKGAAVAVPDWDEPLEDGTYAVARGSQSLTLVVRRGSEMGTATALERIVAF
jgi:hypothetical protein